MLMTLLDNGGQCSDTEIAKNLLIRDESQIDYYRNITNNMVGKVLRNHGLVERDKDTKTYTLIDFDSLEEDEIAALKELCLKKLEEFLDKRGKLVYQHRRKSAGYISGTLRYEVLKRAKFRCELCGISAYEKALEVDHIVPRNHGGSDDVSNLQALCYSCNAMKRDRDDTDFRKVRESYEHRERDCVFCEIDKSRILAENQLGYVIFDNYPVTQLHSLIIPKRHVPTYFELGQAEINACNQLLQYAKGGSLHHDKSITGFNIGINNGESAGQTIFHCHIHLIPRRRGDVDNPRGGVRHVILGKGNY
ncbi:MAG: HIT domain-containing protein [Acidobacteria bacterium]|nr:HIT domain-containing protein [Acidobacteriota bacterium]